MATELIMRRVGSGMFPIDEVGAELLENINQGVDVKAVVSQPRNPGHHRKFWKLITKVQAQIPDRYPSPKSLESALCIATGRTKIMGRKKVDGEVHVFVEPASISYASMSQNEFEPFYSRCMEIICRDIMPGLDDDDLARELETA